MRRRRTLTPEERHLWAHVVRDFVPLRGRSQIALSNPPAPVAPQTKAASRAPFHKDGPPIATVVQPARVPPPSPPAIPPLAPLERKARSRIRRGVTAIDDVLDLHGLRQIEAHDRLRGFLHRARARGSSVVMVVTGKGAAGVEPSSAFEERGVLRRLVPHWLRLPDLRPLVLGFEEAAPHHGGSGALYVRLRRGRGSP